MATQALNKTKIIKKHKKHINRFEADRWHRVHVSVPIVLFNSELMEKTQRY